jgi:quercetin dioxygenase-like cupin family protein
MEEVPKVPVFVQVAEEAHPLTMLGATVATLATSAQTGGAWSLVKYTAPPHYAGPPLHLHRRTTEAFYMLEGTLAFTLDDRTITASTGAFIVVPPNICHTFFNPTAAPATYLVWFSPGGHEQFFDEVATLCGAGAEWQTADPTILEALNHTYDQYIVPAV